MQDDRIPRQKLGPIIDEIEQLENESQNQLLDRGQVRDVLQQVAVPTHRLDEAVARVDARELEQAQNKAKKRKLFLAVGAVVTALSLGTATLVYVTSDRAAAVARVSASDAQLSVAGVARPSGSPIKSGVAQEIQLDVVLHDAPTGRSLDMACDWVGPSGQTVYESHYQTKTIDRANWPTHCKAGFKTSAPAGAWTVRMKVADHVVIETPFTLELHPGFGALAVDARRRCVALGDVRVELSVVGRCEQQPA